ncbi:DNA polymerase/3'-5' exonuclease PolX [Streptomyces sp. UNOB3_S3]|uniref:DNA polymerase/3'-5' exonuclease PolX n=1 Tax=Streptomyces sp. UNOB3_S3 TaxID=2871682 RepID=UPI001E2F4119|nr:DNA polymerase/3'-5' exonuclease PolX [Streptomyces sp. UNOB3_S3]MCC3773523.1 DNA polymerase/3'-5' exonuclease PolX [Streptomyces sp. UNOB3_S3]
MARPNEEVAAVLQEYADLVAITGGDAFKARAYEKAARAIGGHPSDVSKLDIDGLREIPNVGKSIAEKVVEYLGTGRVAAFEETRTSVPPGVRELLTIPTLGPHKALVLYEELGVSSVDGLLDAIHQERLRDLKGFGEKTEQNILHGIELMKKAGGRILLSAASDAAERIVADLSRIDGCESCAFAGSLRRMRETIGDVDVLVAADRAEPFMEAISTLPYTAEVIARGLKKTSVRTVDGLQIDLRVLPPDAWGAGLLYFTGSKPHNIQIREIAVRQGWKLSEYGLFYGKSGKKITSETEEAIYAKLGLPWIPPALREDRGEVAAGLRDELPTLIEEADIRGDLHTHTDLTDGLASLEDMIAAAAERGYAYYAITDHAPNLYMQRMTDAKMLAQREQIRKLDGKHRKIRLLHGTELNIGPDGDVDWPEEFLAGFDLCVASVHDHFKQNRAEQTRRLIRACENPAVSIIGHPTTRLLGKRPGIDADFDEVFAACARTGTALEINAHPERLDLGDEDILRARRHGVKFSINTDAHSVMHLPYMRYGVGTAQRGWLTKDDVINTWPLQKLRRFLRPRTR